MRGRNGTTLLEVMIVIAIFSIVAVGVFEIVQNMTVANLHMSAQNELTDWGDSALNAIKDDVLQSRLVYENDAIGNNYLSRCAFPPAALPLSGSRLPVIDELSTFVPDVAGAEKTGNIILFVRCLPPQDMTITGSAPVLRRSIDLYRFVAYYLTKAPGRPIGNRADSLVLMTWESQLYADKGQIEALSTKLPDPPGGEKEDIVRQLVASGVDC